jgi:beta-lactamase class D
VGYHVPTFGKYTEIRKIGFYTLAESHLFSLNHKDCKQVYLPESLFTIIRARFKGERPGLSPQGLDKTKSTDFIETFASQILLKVRV